MPFATDHLFKTIKFVALCKPTNISKFGELDFFEASSLHNISKRTPRSAFCSAGSLCGLFGMRKGRAGRRDEVRRRSEMFEVLDGADRVYFSPVWEFTAACWEPRLGWPHTGVCVTQIYYIQRTSFTNNGESFFQLYCIVLVMSIRNMAVIVKYKYSYSDLFLGYIRGLQPVALWTFHYGSL